MIDFHCKFATVMQRYYCSWLLNHNNALVNKNEVSLYKYKETCDNHGLVHDFMLTQVLVKFGYQFTVYDKYKETCDNHGLIKA